MSTDPARRVWITLETLHDVVYFAPEMRAAGVALGLRGYWMTYFAFRAAPLGPVDAGVVIATFANFHPDRVTRAIPDAWTRASPASCLAVRSQVAADALRSAGLSASVGGLAVGLLAPVAAGLDLTGRPLGAANAMLTLPEDPVAALWQLAATLREHRGDGHVAALVAAGVSGLEAHVLQVAAGRFTMSTIQTARGWSDSDWSAAAARLRERGLLEASGSPVLAPAGQSLLAEIEDRTNSVAWSGGLSALGNDGVDEVCSLLQPAVAAVRASGLLPVGNPAGLPVA
jgi:hypothetical protein